jgi:hypothetical protein
VFSGLPLPPLMAAPREARDTPLAGRPDRRELFVDASALTGPAQEPSAAPAG